MIRKWFILFLVLRIPLHALDSITVSQGTLRIGGLKHKVIYFGMAADDKLVFTFETLNGKTLHTVEITEQPGTIRYSGGNAKGLNQTSVKIAQTGVFEFHFKNSALSGRHCRYKIQRVPASPNTINFNTRVYIKTINDTVFYTKSGNIKLVNDTAIYDLVNQQSKVHSTLNLHGNDNCIDFVIPKNTIAWSYYIGVDQQGQYAYEKATQELAKSGSPFLFKIPNFGPLAALALYSTSYFARLQSGEDVDYEIELKSKNDTQPVPVFERIKHGKVINDFARLTNPLEGSYRLCLHNDNAITGISVLVKVNAIVVTKKPNKQAVTKIKVKQKEIMYLQD